SDITSKESTLQVVYDVLRLTLFYKAFLVTEDVPEIYMQEFWATAIVHHHSIRFKIHNKKRIVNLEYFREMLHICPRIPNQAFDELLFEEEILAFLRYLGHRGEIKKITDVNVNKLHLPWRSFADVINKCLNRKSIGYDSLRDDQMFTMIKLVSRHQNTQQFGASPPKTKASVRKTQSSSDTTMPPPTVADTRLSTSAKGKQPTKLSKAKGLSVLSEVALTEAGEIKLATKRSLKQTHISQASRSSADVPTDESDEEISWKTSDKDDDDKVDDQNEADDDDDDQEDEDEDVNINLEGRDVQMTNIHITQVLEDTHVTLTPVNHDGQQQSSSVSSQFVTSMFNPSLDAGIDSLFGSTHRVDVPVLTIIVPLLVTAPTIPLPTIPLILREEAQPENEDFLNKLDENIQNIIKELVKEQVKTSYAMTADLSELELKKILIDKMKRNKSIHRSDEQRNLYKALVDAYECDKIILDTYGDTVTLKRRRDDEDKDEEPSAGSDWGSKRRREGKEPETTSAPKEKASRTTGATDDQPIAEASQHPERFKKQTKPPTPNRAWNKTLPATHGSI
nr:hypothetical protein [Tanacetum cinerariifolium]